MITTSVAEAADSLKRGQVLAYPTEAVWGLGCDPYNEAAFNEILKLKQRPIEKGVILLAGHISQVAQLSAQPLGYCLQMRTFLFGSKVITPKLPFA